MKRSTIAYGWAVLFLALGLSLFAACSGPSSTTGEEPTPGEGAPETRTVEGFRIQIYTTSEKDEADEKTEEALSWWQEVPGRQRPPRLASEDELFLDVAWRAPYYRVRLGRFTSRPEAQDALAFVKERFPEAFIVPDRVTVTR